MEKTFFIIKPDGVKRGLVGEVLSRMEKRGFTIERIEKRMITPDLLQKHYSDLLNKPFYPKIEAFMTSGPVIIGVVSGEGVVASWRLMMGATDPAKALPGTIRGDFAQAAAPGETMKNIVHGSDSLESAEREVKIWFEEK